MAETAAFRDEKQDFYIIWLLSQSISADFLPKSQEGCVKTLITIKAATERTPTHITIPISTTTTFPINSNILPP